MEGSTKRERYIDLIVQWIGDDHQIYFYKGSVSEEDVEVLKSLMFMGTAEREKHVRASKESQISKVLQKIFVYNDNGDEEDVDFPSISEQGTFEYMPCHFVVFFGVY